MSVAAMSTFSSNGSSAVPALPGATKTLSAKGDCDAFHASACSRPPLPIIKIFIRRLRVSGRIAPAKRKLMTEMAHVGEQHCNAVFVSRGDHFIVTDRTAWLDNTGNTYRCRSVDTVAEREEGIRSHYGTGYFQAFVSGFNTGNFSGVN